MVWCGVVQCSEVRCGLVWRPKGTVTKRQRPGCLAHRKVQNGWALILNPKSNRCPVCYAPTALVGGCRFLAGVPRLSVGCLPGIAGQVRWDEGGLPVCRSGSGPCAGLAALGPSWRLHCGVVWCGVVWCGVVR